MIQLLLSHWVFFVIAVINRSFDFFLWAHESLLLVNAGFLVGASHFKSSFWGQFDFFLILKLVCRLPLLSRGLLTFPQIFIKYLQGTRCSATCWIEWGIKLGFWPQLAYFLVDGRQESQPCDGYSQGAAKIRVHLIELLWQLTLDKSKQVWLTPSQREYLLVVSRQQQHTTVLLNN